MSTPLFAPKAVQLRPPRELPQPRHWLVQLFTGKTEAEIRITELKEARLALLQAESAREFATGMVMYRTRQIKRLERSLEGAQPT